MPQKLYPIPHRAVPPMEPLVKTGEGTVLTNYEMRFQTHYYLAMDEDAGGIPQVVVPAGGTSRPTFRNDRSAHFEINKFTFRATDARFTVVIRDDGAGRNIMNRPVHIQTIAGSGQTPSIWPASVVLDPARTIQVEVNNLSGADNTVFLYFSGTRYYDEGAMTAKKIRKYPGYARKAINCYFYTTNTDVVLPADVGGVPQETRSAITLREEFDFLAMKINAVAFNAAGVQRDFLFQMSQDNSGRQFQSSWIDSQAGVGTGGFPYVLPQPMLVERTGQIDVVFRNQFFPTEQLTVFFTLLGEAFYSPSEINMRELEYMRGNDRILDGREYSK